MIRHKPFGTRERPLTRSQRVKLSKNKLGTLETYLPPVSPGEDYADDIYNAGKSERVSFSDKLKNLLKKQKNSTKRNIVGFLGDFLGLLREFRKQGPEPVGKTEAEKFVKKLDSDNKDKFSRSVKQLGFQDIGSIPGEEKVKQAVSVAVFENVNLIKNLNQKYFNDVQAMVFKQIGIEVKPAVTIVHEVPKSVEKGKLSVSGILRAKKKESETPDGESTPMEAPHVITIPEMVSMVEKLPTMIDENGEEKIATGNGMAKDIFTILRKELPDEINKEQEKKLKSRANTIARDQTQKVFSALDEARGKDNGFVWYIWSASGGDNPDNRVRDTHRANNGKVFHVDYPPKETGAPGHDINCRCRRKFIYLKSELSKITIDQLGYKDEATRKKVAELLPGKDKK